jgi:membrane protease YdiL (CAAX protease family)
MHYKKLKIGAVLLLICLMVLFIARKVLNLYIDKIEVNYLILSIIKLVVLYGVIKFIAKENYYKRKFFKNNFIFSALIIVVTLFSYSNTQKVIVSNHFDINTYLHIVFIFKCFATGFFEEIVFRVFLFNSIIQSHIFLQKKNIFTSYILTSVLFGLVHFTNVSTSDFFNVLNQVLLAFGLGMIFQVLLAKYNNILFISSLHSLINYFGTRNSVLFCFKESDNETVSIYEVFMNLSVFVILDLIIIVYVYYFIKGLDLEKESF